MPQEKDALFGDLAVERGYLRPEQLTQAREAQRTAAAAAGLAIPLWQVCLNKGLLTADQAQELRNAVAVETGEARLVAGYEVISKLGQGGMGAVYRAKSQTTGQFVALKILPPSLATDELVKRFEREAEVVSKLDHEHIVGCVEFGFDPRRKVHFCALELIDGEDLDKRIARLGVLSEEEATRVTLEIAQALQHAFFNGLVHRDIKPPNIMIARDGSAKLLDLGLARSANMEVTRLTQTGAFVGSPYYASPEQATGERDIDIRSDIYSLGCTLYHMVTGKPPFGGTTVIQVLQQHLTAQMPWPKESNPALSDGLCQIIAKMMAKRPADRYQEPKELLADLDMHLRGEEPQVGEEALKGSSVNVPIAVRRRVRERVRAPRPARESERRAPAAGPTDTRRHRRAAAGAAPAKKGAPVAMIAAGALVAVLVLGLGALMMGGKKKPREKPPAGGERDGGDTLRADASGGAAQADSPGEGQPPVDPRKVSPTGAEAPLDEPPPTLTLDLGGGVEMELVYIKPGTFMMGSDSKKETWLGSEGPVHEVTLTKAFYVARFEVTQLQYETVMQANPSRSKGASNPIDNVCWHDAAEFCRRASVSTGREVRLPTEAQWEYACRAGTTGPRHFEGGSGQVGAYAWTAHDSGGETHPVGTRKPNAWGLHDMYGNVWEWVTDRYSNSYHAAGPRVDPTGPDAGEPRVLRGGDARTDWVHCTSAVRQGHSSYHRFNGSGLRVAVTASPEDAQRAPGADIAALLAGFDALMSKGDHAGAREFAEREAAKVERERGHDPAGGRFVSPMAVKQGAQGKGPPRPILWLRDTDRPKGGPRVHVYRRQRAVA